ncbi:MAG: serine hydrolase domain-containing protein [Chitinophagaceae bacterium]
MRPTFSLQRLACIVMFTAFVACSGAQVLQTSGFHPHVNYERLKRIDSVINKYISNQWIAGAVTLVVKDGRVVQYKGYGYDDINSKKSLSKDAIFRIASQTKAIVSVAVMMLYEEGKFLLTDPIENYIPEFKNGMVLDKFNEADTTYTSVPVKRKVTIKDLLTHTSGLGYAVIGSREMNAIYAKSAIPSGIGELKADLADKMKTLAGLPLASQPGAKWSYSLGVDVLGYLVEKISGMTLDDYLKKKIFLPLGMTDTYFNLPADKFGRLATLYTEDSLHHLAKQVLPRGGISPDYPKLGTHYFSGGAGLSSTAYDYAQFLQMMLNHGVYNGVEILSPRTVEMMTQNQIGDLVVGAGNKFGLGFEIVTEKVAAESPKNIGSFGWGGYFGTTYWADPKEKMVCLIMTQQSPNSHSDLSKKFEVLVYQALK